MIFCKSKAKRKKGNKKSYLIAYRITKLLPFKADGSLIGEPIAGKKAKQFSIKAFPIVKIPIKEVNEDVSIWNACIEMIEEFETRNYLKESVDEILESIRECNLG